MPVPTTLSSTEDAIRLADCALGEDHLVAIVDGSAKLVLPIAGSPPPEAIVRLDELLLAAIGDEPDRLVLATRRCTGPAFVLEDELARWRELRRQHDGRALQLFDWLVFVRSDVVLSLAELAGPAARWAA